MKSTGKLLQWIELSSSALSKNIASLTRLASGRKLAICVKANAYGHGLPQVVEVLAGIPTVDYLTVHSIEEAEACRSAGWERRIMLVGPVVDKALESVFDLDLEPVIFTRQTLSRLGKLSDKHRRPVRTHLKLETGTNRQGIIESELEAFASIYKKHRHLKKPYGASTHFANIEDTTSHEYAQGQLKRFNAMIRALGKLGVRPTIRHTACSAALILFENTRFDLVRPGIAAYGHWPSKETYLSYRLDGGRNDIFGPVLSWRARITQLKTVPADSFVGYGCTYRTTARTRLAVLPVGYSDGYSRALSNQAYVLIGGQRAPVRGRICMNLMMVDTSDIKGVKTGDVATLIGRDNEESLPTEQLASWAGTINYEILARLSQTPRRVITA